MISKLKNLHNLTLANTVVVKHSFRKYSHIVGEQNSKNRILKRAREMNNLKKSKSQATEEKVLVDNENKIPPNKVRNINDFFD